MKTDTIFFFFYLNLLGFHGASNSLRLSSSPPAQGKKIKQMCKVHFRVKTTPTCDIASCARLRPMYLENRALREHWVVMKTRVCYETSNTLRLWLIQKALHIVAYSTNKIWWWLSHWKKNAQSDCAPSGDMWKTTGPIQWILGERDETEKTELTLTCMCASVRL